MRCILSLNQIDFKRVLVCLGLPCVLLSACQALSERVPKADPNPSLFVQNAKPTAEFSAPTEAQSKMLNGMLS